MDCNHLQEVDTRNSSSSNKDMVDTLLPVDILAMALHRWDLDLQAGMVPRPHQPLPNQGLRTQSAKWRSEWLARSFRTET